MGIIKTCILLRRSFYPFSVAFLILTYTTYRESFCTYSVPSQSGTSFFLHNTTWVHIPFFLSLKINISTSFPPRNALIRSFSRLSRSVNRLPLSFSFSWEQESSSDQFSVHLFL